jgi:hypothetical protein
MKGFIVKITRRQLRKLIRESVYVDPEGVAVDAAADTLKQFERFDKIVDYLHKEKNYQYYLKVMIQQIKRWVCL